MKKTLTLSVLLITSLLIQGCSTPSQPDDMPSVQQPSTLQESSTTVVIETNYGTMEAMLYDSTPKHRDNFIKLVEEWFYDDLLFHRVIEWFMIQWWDPESRNASAWASLGRWWPWYLIDAEIQAPHFKGTLAAARTWWSSNPEKKSSGSQFYIVQWTPQTQNSLQNMQIQKWITYTPQQVARYIEVWGTPMLDNDYTVFGEVIVWLEVIDAIAAVETNPSDRPAKDITMKISLK